MHIVQRYMGKVCVCVCVCVHAHRASQVALVVKNLPASAGDIRDRGLVTGGDDPLEEGTATHSSILVWRFLWIGEPERLQSVGLQRVRHN